MYQLLADAVVLLHFLFIVLVLVGGLLVFRWPRAAWVHLPAAAWGALVELLGWECPLTPLENRFRRLAGGAPYEGDFLTRYLVAVIYPEHLTAATQIVLGGVVIVGNVAVYALAIHRRKTRAHDGGHQGPAPE